MKKDTVTITRAEYAHLNKAANAAVEHACELFKAARLVDDLKARIAELEEDNNALERRIANVQADRDEWRHCHAMSQDENAALKARVEFWMNLVAKMEGEFEELEAENAELKDRVAGAELGCEELENYGKELEADVNTLQVKLAAREEYIESQEATIRFLKRACGWNN